MSPSPTSPSRRSAFLAVLPGLLACAAALGVGLLVALWAPSISPLTVCVLAGVTVANCGLDIGRLRPGLQFAAKRLLRLGIVVLGLRLAVPDVLRLGLPTLAVIVGCVALTFFGTQALGRLLGVNPGTRLLMATGFSICGASAIAAMDGVTDNDEADVVTSITMVTLFGSLAIVVLPLLQRPLGLNDHQFGMWAGASVHDVAQTVATASVAGAAALSTAVIVKLTRVVLLAPMVAAMSLYRRRIGAHVSDKRPPLLPLFVAGFIAMVALRSTGWLPASVLNVAQHVETVLLGMALFGLGAGVRIGTLIRTGGRALLLGLTSWVLIAAVAYGGVLLVT
ncbi:putative sulfate exporter family transporter [Nakamurella aerolata]|uniref:Putative sulfate exporter family transporter n=1 Tax=Nakamurella aerolata TaxID=1656892 RepID=A0A849AD20_9ACTN|nr:putative sulfate exporter family transporter [Nakamurella aerolata]